MTGAIANDMRAAVNSLQPGKSMASSGGKGDFMAVWKNHTAGSQPDGAGGQAETAAKKTSQPSETVKGETIRARQEKTVNPKEKEEDVEETDAPENMDEETLEAMMQLLAASADGFAQQVAQELGISVEELDGLLQKLGMDHMDLLDPGALTQVVLNAGGAQDMLDLVTNGELYQKLQNLTAGLEEVKAGLARETGLSMQELTGMIEQAQIPAGEEPGQPVIAIETQEQPAEDENAGKLQNKTEQTVNQTSEETPADLKTQTAGKERGSQHQDTGAGKENSGLLAQNPAQRLEQAGLQPAAEPVFTPQAPDTETIMRQLLDYMKIQLKPDLSNLEMQLHPESLGTLHIQLTAKQGAVTAQFVTQNESVKAALESQMIQLKESFEEQGVRVDSIEVTVQSHEFDRNLDRGNGREQESSSKRGRGRKINLNLPAEAEGLTEEEQITADLMAANGNTVDYTA